MIFLPYTLGNLVAFGCGVFLPTRIWFHCDIIQAKSEILFWIALFYWQDLYIHLYNSKYKLPSWSWYIFHAIWMWNPLNRTVRNRLIQPNKLNFLFDMVTCLDYSPDVSRLCDRTRWLLKYACSSNIRWFIQERSSCIWYLTKIIISKLNNLNKIDPKAQCCIQTA